MYSSLSERSIQQLGAGSCAAGSPLGPLRGQSSEALVTRKLINQPFTWLLGSEKSRCLPRPGMELGGGWGVGLQGVLGVSRTAEGEKDLITEDSQFEVRNIGARG